MNRDRMPSISTRIATLAIIACGATVWAQTSTDRPDQSASANGAAEFEKHLDQLTSQLESMRQQLQESQKEMDELRAELRSLRTQLTEKSQSEEAAQDDEPRVRFRGQLDRRLEVYRRPGRGHDDRVEAGAG